MTKLQEQIINVLKDNGGRMDERELCNQLNISSKDIPWGYNIGYARLLQIGSRFDVVLSGVTST